MAIDGPILLVLPPRPLRLRFVELIGAAYPDLEIHDAATIDELEDKWAEAKAIFTFGQFLTDEAVGRASSLRWIQSLGSGVDGIIDRPDLREEVIVTNARGAHRTCVSEAAFALMIALARDLPRLVRAQDRHSWAPRPARLLEGRTVGIFGVGVIAEGLAERCKAFGMKVEGISDRASAPLFDMMHAKSDMVAAVSRFDYFVVLAPLTVQTHGIIDRHVLAAMKPDAFLINVARGGVVDETALLEALQSGKLAGAALDVFSVEPLPETSPFWAMPNVLISPHAGGQHDSYAESVMPIVLPNIAAMRRADIGALQNRIDRGSAE